MCIGNTLHLTSRYGYHPISSSELQKSLKQDSVKLDVRNELLTVVSCQFALFVVTIGITSCYSVKRLGRTSDIILCSVIRGLLLSFEPALHIVSCS